MYQQYRERGEDLKFPGIDLIETPQDIATAREQRTYYEQRKKDLLTLYRHYQNLKQSVDDLARRNRDLLFSREFLPRITHETRKDNACSISEQEERRLVHYQEKIALRKERQADLFALEMQIAELQITIGYHLSELIERRNRANKAIHAIIPEIAQYVDNWCNTNINFIESALALYTVECKSEKLLQLLEQKNKELKVVINHHKHRAPPAVKKSFNLDALIAQEEKNICITENYIAEQRARNTQNKTESGKRLRLNNVNIAHVNARLEHALRPNVLYPELSDISKSIAGRNSKKIGANNGGAPSPNNKGPKNNKPGVGLAAATLAARQETRAALKPCFKNAIGVLRWTAKTFEESLHYSLLENTWKHINDAKHNLQPLLDLFKRNSIDDSKRAFMQAVLAACEGILPTEGVFENIPITIQNYTLFVRGRVMSGVIKWGTMFIP